MGTQKLPKDREDRYDRGVTRLEIVKYVMRYEKGVQEPKIRKFLQEDLGITGLRGIKLHLEKLEKEKILTKTSESGGPNIWTLNYALDYQLGRFLVDEIFLPLSMEVEHKEFITLFKTPGFLFYLKKSEKETWEIRTSQYLMRGVFDYSRISTKQKDGECFVHYFPPYYQIFYDSLKVSPSLFFEMFTYNTSISVLSSLIYLNIKNNSKYDDIRYPEIISKLIAPFLIDYCKYDEIGTALIGHVSEISIKYSEFSDVDILFKELIKNYSDFVVSILKNHSNLDIT